MSRNTVLDSFCIVVARVDEDLLPRGYDDDQLL